VHLHAPHRRFHDRNVLGARNMACIKLLHGANIQVDVIAILVEKLLGFLRHNSFHGHMTPQLLDPVGWRYAPASPVHDFDALDTTLTLTVRQLASGPTMEYGIEQV